MFLLMRLFVSDSPAISVSFVCLRKTGFQDCDRAFVLFYRSGSTVVDYVVRAASFPPSNVAAVTAGILTQLSRIYPVIDESRIIEFSLFTIKPTLLNFSYFKNIHFFNCQFLFLSLEGDSSLVVEPESVFLGNQVTLTCGPPPERLDFSRDWVAEWRRDNVRVLEDDQHRFSRIPEDNTALLTVTNFFNTDTGKEVKTALSSISYLFIIQEIVCSPIIHSKLLPHYVMLFF